MRCQYLHPQTLQIDEPDDHCHGFMQNLMLMAFSDGRSDVFLSRVCWTILGMIIDIVSTRILIGRQDLHCHGSSRRLIRWMGSLLISSSWSGRMNRKGRCDQRSFQFVNCSLFCTNLQPSIVESGRSRVQTTSCFTAVMREQSCIFLCTRIEPAKDDCCC